MSGASRRSSKLTNLKLTLSKYDAKYSKSSTVLQDDSSDEVQEENVQINLQHSLATSQDDSNLIINFDDVAPSSAKLLDDNTVLKTEDNLEASMIRIEHKRSVSDPSKAYSSEESSLLETGSSIDSVKTDSALGFNNVHSVSSLAESVLHFEEGEVRNSSLPTAPKQQSISLQSPSPPVPVDHSINSSKKNTEDNFPQRKSPENLFSSASTETSLSNISLKEISKAQNALEPESHLNNMETKIIEYEALSEKTDRKIESEENAVLKSLDKKPTEIGHKKRYASKDKQNKKSVAIQTSNHLFNLKMSQPTEVREKSRYSAKNVPIVKPLKLPCFLKAGSSPVVHDLLRESSSSADNEISKLVSYHLHLTKEFLERQHRIYIANYKAVQLLERGYRENLLSSTEVRAKGK